MCKQLIPGPFPAQEDLGQETRDLRCLHACTCLHMLAAFMKLKHAMQCNACVWLWQLGVYGSCNGICLVRTFEALIKGYHRPACYKVVIQTRESYIQVAR